ncbi:adenosine receptor A1 [Biomphalaria glabrata]|uniref:G-protein coupled receptors family 1 profile domain-containing protein n=1 Tax=Biomphalaria glabrata TaxID=6526 RepID=A0A2C9KJW3_BIOGL|nr:adenosine receptor A1 [Biomphalaria glabrata]
MDAFEYEDISELSYNMSREYMEADSIIVAHKTVAVFAMLMIPVVLFSNAMVLFSLVASPSLYPGGRLMLLYLTLINLLIGAISLPLFALRQVPKVRVRYFTSRVACLLLLTSMGLPGAGTLYVYTLIALDRFLDAQWPLKYSQIVNDVKSIKVTNFLWTYLVSLCVFIISAWGAHEPTHDPKLLPCKYNSTLTSNFLMGVSSSIFSFLVAVTIVVNLALTLRTLLEVRSYSEEKSTNLTRHKNRLLDYLLDSTKVTNILLIIFFLLWSPSALVTPLIKSQALSEQQIEVYKVTTQLLRLSNAAFHAPAHAIGRKKLRQLFLLMLTTPPWHWNEEMANFHRQVCSSIDGHVRFSLKVTTIDITPATCSPKYSVSSV